MRFGINLWLWVTRFTEQDLDLFDKIRGMGYDWVEIGIQAPAPARIHYRRIGQALRDAGLGVSVSAIMGEGYDLTIEDQASNERALAFLRDCTDAAHDMGGSIVCGPLYAPFRRVWQADSFRRRRELDYCAVNLRRAAQYASDRGVTLAIEPVNRYESSFINTAAQAIELVAIVASPAVRLMADTFHMAIEEKSPAGAIEAMDKQLILVHAGENDRGTPGSGSVDWTSIAFALKKIDFQGPIIIEAYTDAVTEMARLASVWRPTANSQDDLAMRGLAFLKALLGDGLRDTPVRQGTGTLSGG